MRFFQTALGVAALASAAVAQLAPLAFTSTPGSVEAGQKVSIKFTAPLDTPVTIILRQGDPNDLSTVAILTNSATDGEYEWTPSKSLPSGSDYALQIVQNNSNNYSGLFRVTGGSASGSSSSSSASKTSSSSSSSSSSSASSSSTSTSASGKTTVLPVIGGSRANTTSSSNSTGSSATGSAASMATGMNMGRNTTMSSATLTSSRSGSSTASQTSSDSSPTGGADFQGSQTSSGGQASQTSNAASVISGSSPLALILCAVAAMVY